MRHLILIMLSGIFLTMSCDNYIANKREGLKPFEGEEAREAQEEDRK